MTPEQQKAILEEMPTDVIYDELLNRFEHVIFSGLKAKPEDGSPGQRLTSWRYKGDPFVCMGLAYGIMHECQTFRDSDEEPIHADEL